MMLRVRSWLLPKLEILYVFGLRLPKAPPVNGFSILQMNYPSHFSELSTGKGTKKRQIDVFEHVQIIAHGKYHCFFGIHVFFRC